MSVKTIFVALLALMFGGSAALAVVLVAPRSKKAVATDTTPIVIAAIDVGRGVPITAEMVTVRNWPKGMLPPGSCTSLDEVVGKSSRTSMTKDEPIMLAKLAQGKGLHSLVTPGMRAYTIQTPSVSAGVGGFIQPDDRVDVILTVTSTKREDDHQTGGAIATVLLQNVQVLAAGPSLEAHAETTKVENRQLNSVTLLVTSRQAQELTLAQTKGTLNLAMRRDSEATDEAPPPLYLSDLPFLRETPNAGESETIRVPTVEADSASDKVAPVAISGTIRTYRGFTAGRVIIANSVVKQ